MKTFNEFLERPVTFKDVQSGILYHGTHPGFLETIKKEGLVVRKARNEISSSTGVIYLTTNEQTAWEYSYTVVANRAQRAKTKLVNPVKLAIVKINVKDLDVSKLKFDTNRAKRGNEPARRSKDHFEYVGNIPANVLEIITKDFNV